MTTPTPTTDKMREAEKITAFRNIMGDPSMPDDNSVEYDLWLFEAAWQAALATKENDNG